MRKSMRNASYHMERRASKKDNVEGMEAQSKSNEKIGHCQKWMKKTEQPDMNEGIKNEESLIFY
jgi:hypothetical protein